MVDVLAEIRGLGLRSQQHGAEGSPSALGAAAVRVGVPQREPVLGELTGAEGAAGLALDGEDGVLCAGLDGEVQVAGVAQPALDDHLDIIGTPQPANGLVCLVLTARGAQHRLEQGLVSGPSTVEAILQRGREHRRERGFCVREGGEIPCDLIVHRLPAYRFA